MLEVREHCIRLRPLLALVCLWAGVLPAAVEDYEGKSIRVILFEPREQPIPAAELDEILPVRMRQPLRLEEVRAAIERLYATGRYADIAVEAELRNDEVILRFLTTGNWFVGRVTVEGVPQPPTRGQLVNATKLDLGRPVHEEDLTAAVENLRQTIESNGFYESRIDYDVEREARTQQWHIRCRVQPGRRARFAPPEVRGISSTTAERLTRATKWKGWFGWKLVTQARIQSGLERIRSHYVKQNRLMATVTLGTIRHERDTGRAIPVLSVNEGPVVLVEAQGTRLSQGRLKRLAPVYEEGSVDRDLVMEGAENIVEHFQSQGYFDARVDVKQETLPDGAQRILYTIDRGERHKVVRLEIRGASYFDEATIRERMYVAPASPQLRRGRYSEALMRRDQEAIAELYRTNGFRDVKVTSSVQDDYRGKHGDVAVAIDVVEGGQWFVGNLDIEGVAPSDLESVRSQLQSLPGQPFSDANVAADRDNILASYFNNGYSDASFDWTWQPSAKPNQVDLRYTITEGKLRHVREVLIGGLEATERRLIHRRLLLNPGDPVSQTQILETQRRMYDLGIFAKVDTATQNPEGEEPYRNVLYQFEESRKYSIAGGFGAEIARIGGSQTFLDAPAGEAGFSPRVSFDVSRLNFLGRAHTVSFRSRLSTIQRRALFTYLAPQFRGNEKMDVSFSALFDDSRDIRTFSARRWEGSAQLAQRWTRSRTLFYRFAYRRVAVDEGTLKIRPELIPLLSQPVRVGILSAGYVDDRRDDPTDSRKGTYNTLDLGAASRFLGSQTDFFRLLGRNSTYHPLGRKLVLARTLILGWLQTLRKNPDLPPDEQDIPLPERFFAGGASTHRGFPDNQAGPRDELTGFPLGGKALLAFGTEIRFPLIGNNIGGVLFHDAGNVYSRAGLASFRVKQRSLTDFNYMVHAVGFGVRYRTPIGPIRVDLAFAPNSPRFMGFEGTREELLFGGGVRREQRINRFQFHFSLGQSF